MTDRIAFVFPGQGSHRAGMASAWLPQAADMFTDLSDATGLDLVATADDADACGASTRLGQPSITAVSLAALAALTDAGLAPDLVAGHSLGELSAAVAAGVFTPTEGVSLVAARGRAMGQACRSAPGTMAAVVRVDTETVEEVVATIDDVVVANINAPGQVAIAGTQAGIDAATEALRNEGGRVIALPVEGAFHSPAMTPAVVALTGALQWAPARDPEIGLVSGLDGAVRLTGSAVTRALVEGVLAPVRWVDVQHALRDAGVGLLVEVGPGGVLTGLAKRTLPDVRAVSVQTPEDVAVAVQAAAELRDRTPAHV